MAEARGAEAERARPDLYDVFMQASVPFGVMSGPDHRFTFANELYERFVNREILGKTLREAFTPEEGAHVFAIIDRVYQTGEPFMWKEMPVALPDAEGNVRQRYFDVSYTALRDARGNVHAVTCLVIDISDEVDARNAAARATYDLEFERQNFARLFEQTGGFVAIFGGPEFVYEYLNPMNQQILGGDFTGKRLRDVIPDVEGSGLFALFERVYRTGNSEKIVELPLRIGSELRYFDATYVARRNPAGEVDGVMTWGMDTTAQVLARQRLEHALAELRSEREIRERFVVTLSHDLRTPLTAAKLTARLLGKRADDPDIVREMSVRIADSVDRTENMIRDLLDANRIGAGEKIPIDIAPCSLDAIATETLEDLSTIHGDRFRLECDGPIEGQWSCAGLRRILENLATNAIKYGAPARTVRIALRKMDGAAIIEVHNEGTPISAEHQATLFQAYRRTDSAISSGHKGWGLGLTLVKGLAEAHGGRVELESTAEAGTTFRVTLPIDGGGQSLRTIAATI